MGVRSAGVPAATVAVNVTGWPATEGLVSDATVVVVVAAVILAVVVGWVSV